MSYEIRQGDCRALMAELEVESVDAIVTDPPYGLAFMGKEWDHGVPGVPFWTEALRVLKPGGHLAAFGGTRTFHRLACAIEDAGFEIRDCLCWLYGSGFPKSLDVSKALDRVAGAERDAIGPDRGRLIGARAGNSTNHGRGGVKYGADVDTAPSTDAAKQWAGFGTALKPAWEPIILARKPLAGTVAQNVQAHGTGALNVDGCRIGTATRPLVQSDRRLEHVTYQPGLGGSRAMGDTTLGRWPANLILDEDAAQALDEAARVHGAGHERPRTPGGTYDGATGIGFAANGSGLGVGEKGFRYGDTGGASRFFYTAKASSAERHYAGRNNHPTVKPVTLMRWLVRLVAPPGGLVLDPFMGSGSTGIAALAEGMRFLGMELDAASVEIARRRIAGPLFAEL